MGDPRSPVQVWVVAKTYRTMLPNALQLEILMLSPFLLNPLPVCLAICLPPPNPFPSRIADKAFYQQPDADIIGYVYVSSLLLCQGEWERVRAPVYGLSVLLVGYK